MSPIDQVVPELLDESRVKITDYNDVQEKIQRISNDGKGKLQIIMDFDKTLSKYHSNGALTATSHGIFESIPSMPYSYLEGSRILYNKYSPIEFDTKMSIAEKIPLMKEWWNEYEKLVDKLPFTYSSIEEAVIRHNISLRDGSAEAFALLHNCSVPVLLFSAGIGDVIDSMVKINRLNYSNVHIISNFFDYRDGQIQGFKGNRIHIFNKNQHALENSDYFQELSERNNVILLGDSLGDSFMAEGVPGNGTILKIGFLNSRIEESLPHYLSHFDIVLIDDQTMDIFNAILHKVFVGVDFEDSRMSELNIIPELSHSNVKISNKDNVNNKLNKMRQEGAQSIHAIFDFDKTLTKSYEHLTPDYGSLQIFSLIDSVPDWFKNSTIEMWKAVDETLYSNKTESEKTKTMNDLVLEFEVRLTEIPPDINITQKLQEESIKRYELRNGVDSCFSILRNNSIPCTILSSGFGNVIDAIMKYNKINMTNVKVIANYLTIVDGKIHGFTEKFIHVFRKNEQTMKLISQSQDLMKRQNFIVVGDSLGDASMADGVSESATNLSIGILNSNVR